MVTQVTAASTEATSVVDAPFYVIAEATAGWDGAYTQLGRGPSRGELHQVRLHGVDLALDRMDNDVRAIGVPPPGGVVLALAAAEGQAVSWRGRAVAPNTWSFRGPIRSLMSDSREASTTGSSTRTSLRASLADELSPPQSVGGGAACVGDGDGDPCGHRQSADGLSESTRPVRGS